MTAPKVFDGALAAAVVVVVSVAIAADLGGGRPPDVFAYAFAVGLGALMLVRLSFPVLALVATVVGFFAYYAADYPSIGLAVPVAAALYSAAEAGRIMAAVIACVVLLTLSSAYRVSQGQSLAYLFGYEFATSVVLMAAVVLLGDGVRTRRLLREEMRLRAERAEIERQQEATRQVELERMHIARDLHDVIAHTVSVISLHSNVADEALDDDLPAARVALARIREASGDTMRELRASIGLLRGADGVSTLPTSGLSRLDRLAESSGLPVTVHIEGNPTPLPAIVDTTAYRIVQESLTNVLRHANATRAEVLIRYGDDLAIEITDDGTGRPDDTGDGHGLVGMRERAALLGGTVTTASRPDGFSVAARLPLS
ncbi:sensor histidine kinase [Kutzneria sp. 744]|uniref:sensor histidine kinase n=1 Tax=Kutzneria sp. (strain 744) TaxID=345341 RepID=UPI0003EED203|nr:sensor histidine kinase [Kutzneria sp. 744]EWM17737.1 signal transduction histidine kinase [Kutzneria sp. 744]